MTGSLPVVCCELCYFSQAMVQLHAKTRWVLYFGNPRSCPRPFLHFSSAAQVVSRLMFFLLNRSRPFFVRSELSPWQVLWRQGSSLRRGRVEGCRLWLSSGRNGRNSLLPRRPPRGRRHETGQCARLRRWTDDSSHEDMECYRSKVAYRYGPNSRDLFRFDEPS